jgi:hypothetical protein
MTSSRLFLIQKSVITLVLLAAAASAQTYLFNAAKFPTGHNPQSVALADFNKDGNSDLVIANYNDDTVSVLRGVAGGNFQAKVDYAVGPKPISVTVGDFNADGKLDLAVVNQNCAQLPCPGPGSVSILMGNGDGTFQTQQVTVVGQAPTTAVIGDFNKDSNLDLAVTNGQDNNISVLLGAGNESFTRKDFSVSTNDQSLTAGDFDNDGNLDLAVANKAKNNVSILLGKGDGTFRQQLLVATGSGPIPHHWPGNLASMGSCR